MSDLTPRQRALDAAVRLNAPGIGFYEWSKSRRPDKLPAWWFQEVAKDFHRLMSEEPGTGAD